MARQAEAGTVTVTGGRFFLRRNKDTSVNAIELLKPADAAPPTPGGIILLLRAMTNVVAMLLNSTNLANGTIRELSLTNCALHLEDLANSKPVRLDLDRIAVNAKNISNRAGTNMTADVSLRWDTNGTVRADIKAALSPASAEVTLAFDKLNLRPLAPYLEPYLDVFVLGSKLGLAGTVRLRGAKDELPEVRFQGDAWLDEFSTAEGTRYGRLAPMGFVAAVRHRSQPQSAGGLGGKSELGGCVCAVDHRDQPNAQPDERVAPGRHQRGVSAAIDECGGGGAAKGFRGFGGALQCQRAFHRPFASAQREHHPRATQRHPFRALLR